MERSRWVLSVVVLSIMGMVAFSACSGDDPVSNEIAAAFIISIVSPDRDYSLVPGGTLDLNSAVTGGTPPFNFQWNLNLASPFSSTEQDPPPLQLPSKGAFIADVTVTDAENRVATDKRRITVTDWRHLDLTIDNFLTYDGKSAHFVVLDNTDKLVNHSRMIRMAFDGGTRWVMQPNAVPPGAGNRLFAWIDEDANAKWDATDPSTSFAITDGMGTIKLTVAGSMLAPASPPSFTEDQPITILMDGLSAYQGRGMVGRFIENDTGHTRGQFYIHIPIGGQLTANITGISRNGTDYRLMFFVDDDDDDEWGITEMGYRWQGTAGLIFLESFSPSAPGNFTEGTHAEFEIIF